MLLGCDTAGVRSKACSNRSPWGFVFELECIKLFLMPHLGLGLGSNFFLMPHLQLSIIYQLNVRHPVGSDQFSPLLKWTPATPKDAWTKYGWSRLALNPTPTLELTLDNTLNLTLKFDATLNVTRVQALAPTLVINVYQREADNFNLSPCPEC